MVHRRRFSLAYLALILLVLMIQQGGVHSQDQNGEKDKEANKKEKEDKKKDKNKKETSAPSPVPTNRPTSKPTPTPTTPMPSDMPSSSQSPTNVPTAGPFLLRRPLEDFQVRLLGVYDPDRREELLDSLKQILRHSLYDSMVDFFQVNKEEPARTEQGRSSSTIGTTTTLTNSILSEVSLEWTRIDFQEHEHLQILQANGTLGFTEYNYFLLHPQTILQLQNERMGLSIDGNDSAISPLQVELALRRNNFFFQVLQFTVLENKDEENNDKDEIEDPITKEPTAQPTEEEAIDSNSENNVNDNKDLDAYGEEPSDESPTADYDDYSYGEEPPSHEQVSNDAIAIASTIGTILLVISSVIFFRYVFFKSKQIKDRQARSKPVSEDGKSTSNDEEKKGNTKDEKNDPAAATSWALNTTMSAGTLSPDNSIQDISSACSSEDSSNDKDEILLQMNLALGEEQEADGNNDSPKDLEAGEDGINPDQESDSKEDKKDAPNRGSWRLPLFFKIGRINGTSRKKKDPIVDDDESPKDLNAREAGKDPEQVNDNEKDSIANDDDAKLNGKEEVSNQLSKDIETSDNENYYENTSLTNSASDGKDDADDPKDVKVSGDESHSEYTAFVGSASRGKHADADADAKDIKASGDESQSEYTPFIDSVSEGTDTDA